MWIFNFQEVLHAADRTIKYKEENRQILKESIEVAPFTAKILRPSDPGLDRDRSKEPAFPVRIPALASSSPKTSHTHPHVIQPEKSSYYTTISNSVVNEPPRLYPSKEQSSYYDKVVGLSVGAAVQSQGSQSLVSYSSKASLSKPPPLIKHQPEGGEGLAGKITEQLSQQATLIPHQHLTSMDRKDRHSPAASNTTSTSSPLSLVSNHHQHQQHQLRAMPSLYRAPVYHPPTQLSLERKETAEREKDRERDKAGYGGRLSPPTLTPIQPVSLPTAGTKTSAEQQKPPTLVPELRDVKVHGIGAAITSVASVISGDVMTDGWRGRDLIQERGSVFCRDTDVLRGKPQAAMASVIVRPATSVRYESPVGANKSGATVHREVSMSYPSRLPGECPRLREAAQEAGGGRVIQVNSNMDDVSVPYKATSMQSYQGPVGVSNTNSMCRSPVVFSPAVDVQNKPPKSGYSAEFGNLKPGVGGWLPSLSGEGVDSHSISPGLSLPLTNSAAAALLVQSNTSASSPITASNQPNLSSFVHLKKHKAALAAAQSKTNLPAGPASLPTGNTSSIVDPVEKTPSHSSTPPPCTSGISSGEISNTSCAPGSTTPGTSSPLPNGQSSGSTLLGSAQPSNYHKLKKAWLTRHSEEDKTSTTASSNTKAEKLLTTTTSMCNTTAMSDMIKPCTVNLSASTSSEVDMNKDIGSKGERNLEGKNAGSTGGGGEEKKSSHLSRRAFKRSYDSGSESGGDDSDTSESKMEGRAKRQSKPTYKKKQNDMAKRKGDHEKEDEDVKPNGIFRSAREKTKLKLASSSKSCTVDV